MTKDEVISLARQAAAKHGHTLREVPQTETVELLVEFFIMATARAREECARMAEAAAWNKKDIAVKEQNTVANLQCVALSALADSIRALNAAPLKPCRSPYCECSQGHCTHPGFYDARAEPLPSTQE